MSEEIKDGEWVEGFLPWVEGRCPPEMRLRYDGARWIKESRYPKPDIFEKTYEHVSDQVRKDSKVEMNVHDCMREIRKATDAIDTLDKYLSGEMCGIAEQHINQIREMLCEYIDMIENKTVD